MPPLIRRAKDCAITAPRVCIGPGRQIKSLGIGRVQADTFDAVQIPVVLGQPILQRDPPLAPSVPSVRTADVGSRINESAFLGVLTKPPPTISTFFQRYTGRFGAEFSSIDRASAVNNAINSDATGPSVPAAKLGTF